MVIQVSLGFLSGLPGNIVFPFHFGADVASAPVRWGRVGAFSALAVFLGGLTFFSASLSLIFPAFWSLVSGLLVGPALFGSSLGSGLAGIILSWSFVR